MTEWQPWETAPLNEYVEVGYWSINNSHKPGVLVWKTSIDIARRKARWLWSETVYEGYTSPQWWRPLPPPPNQPVPNNSN